MLDRDDVAGWIEGLANGGKLSRRSVQICRTVLRAALSEAVDEGLISRSPAARVGLPRTVAKPKREKETETWTVDEVEAFLEATSWHRWAIAFRLNVLHGLRRTEILAHHRTGASNGPTEGLNLLVKDVKDVKRCGRGFKRFEHYRLRVLLRAGRPTWPHRPTPPTLRTPRPHINA